MNVVPEPGLLGSQQTLYDHALRLHRLAPDSPLDNEGAPFPDEERHRERGPGWPRDKTLVGADVARVLREYFADPGAGPDSLHDAFHGLLIPIYPNENITAVAEQADPELVRATGRWLVRHGTDRCPATVGLALLAVAGTVDDIPLIQIVGLMSDSFGVLAAEALKRLNGNAATLIWLADRVIGWGRVRVVETLCGIDDPAIRPWLLRRAINGDALNGYFAARVARVAVVHEAIEDPGVDEDVVDHTGSLLNVICHTTYGMGMPLEMYKHGASVMYAHARHLRALKPTGLRFAISVSLLHYVTTNADGLDWPSELLQRIRETYFSVLVREDWCEAARRAVTHGDEQLNPRFLRWVAGELAPQLGLRAFEGLELPA
ncbi:hypothetical protein [Actinokineospora enzanensis]|uniref:hypothetical protein n=1 Tax=Actinokineospora enzanensis TaxID=155975 RepID=UPI0003743537|nr:hypothetical protein [Actinokineospora enzanensis]